MDFRKLVSDMETLIASSYEEGITIPEAEALASRFLYAQLQVSTELRKVDLDSRMRKTGVKAVRAAIYLETVKGTEKKPTEAQIAALIDTNDLVSGEQSRFDRAEVERNELERIYDVFGNAHVHFRNISKGRFE